MNQFISLIKRLFFIAFLFNTAFCEEIFYSQSGQDRFLHEHVFKGKRNGVFVDIGAYDGITLSNSYFFEQTLGWTGICVEPIPATFEKLKSIRKALCIQGCISDKYETASFMHVQGSPEMLSGILENLDPRHVERILNEIKQDGGSFEIIPVRCYNINKLLLDNNITHVDYLSLDIEGGELEVLKSIDYSKIDIDVIDVENNYGADFQSFLQSKGYEKIAEIPPDEIYQKTR